MVDKPWQPLSGAIIKGKKPEVVIIQSTPGKPPEPKKKKKPRK